MQRHSEQHTVHVHFFPILMPVPLIALTLCRADRKCSSQKSLLNINGGPWWVYPISNVYICCYITIAICLVGRTALLRRTCALSGKRRNSVAKKVGGSKNENRQAFIISTMVWCDWVPISRIFSVESKYSAFFRPLRLLDWNQINFESDRGGLL